MSNRNGASEEEFSVMDSSAHEDGLPDEGEQRDHMTISSDEVNFLIHRYMLECGFVHAAFAFAHESMLLNGVVPQRWRKTADKTLPPGALISFLQKGLQYIGMEESVLEQQQERKKKAVGEDCPAPSDFTLLSQTTIQSLSRTDPPIHLTIPPEAAAAAIRSRIQTTAPEISTTTNVIVTNERESSPTAVAPVENPPSSNSIKVEEKETGSKRPSSSASTNGDDERVKKQKVERPEKVSRDTSKSTFSTIEEAMAQLQASKQQKGDSTTEEDRKKPQPEERFNGSSQNGIIHVASVDTTTSMDVDPPDDNRQKNETSALDDFAVKPSDVLLLDKHQSEVFMCSWNPIHTNLVATGSGDASARIWNLSTDDKLELRDCILLPHDSGEKKNKDVTTLAWSSDGSWLATGSYDGIARVWDRSGTLVETLRGHQGPIFSLKWNRRGNCLLSGSYDKTIIVWNVSSFEPGAVKDRIQRQFKDHEAPALDVDWKDDEVFASCSTDRTVHVYSVNEDAPRKIYRGHEDEVNAVKWNPAGTCLASCSDDCTAKVWEVSSDRMDPLFDLTEHEQEIYTVKWSPTGPGSPHPEADPLLATASFDGSVRLWSTQNGSCVGFFNEHRDSVYSVSFSPSGNYLASGSLAGQLYIWDIASARYVMSYKGEGDIFEVSWNSQENRIAACFSSNVVAVLKFDAAKQSKLLTNNATASAAQTPDESTNPPN